MFNSFCRNPNIRFETQKDQEKIILLLRAHPITLLPYFINGILLIIILIFINFLPISFITFQQLVFINVMSIIFIISYIWYNLIKWFYNVGIITDERIIDIDYSNIIYKEVTEAQLRRIEDTTAKSAGYFFSFFDIGTLFIQTAGEENNIEFINIPKPEEVVKIINDLISH